MSIVLRFFCGSVSIIVSCRHFLSHRMPRKKDSNIQNLILDFKIRPLCEQMRAVQKRHDAHLLYNIVDRVDRQVFHQ